MATTVLSRASHLGRARGGIARRSMSSTPVIVCGGGRMGHVRLQALAQNSRASLAGFVDVSPQVRQTVADEYNLPTFETLGEAAEATSPAAVWICSPTFAHVPLIKEAARTGLHVAVEKPVSENLAEIIQCYDACEEAGRELFCSFQRRFDPHYSALAQSVHSGSIGIPAVIHTVFRDYPCPPVEFLKTGGDPFNDLFVHDIDFVNYLLQGEEACEVFASGTSYIPELKELGVMDTAVTRVRFESGTVYNGEFTRSSTYGYDQRCEVYGASGAMVRVVNPSENEFEQHGVTPMAITRAGVIPSWPVRWANAFNKEVDHFLDVLNGDCEVSVTKQDALKASVLCDAALQSAKRGVPVKILKPDGDSGKYRFETLEIKDGNPTVDSWHPY